MAVLHTPRAMALGTEPYATSGKCIFAVVVLLCGLLLFIPGHVPLDSAWYSRERGWRSGE